MKTLFTAALVAALVLPASAQVMTAREIIRRGDRQMRGETSRGEMEMSITTPDWQRTMRMQFWESATDDKAFVRVLSPARDRGTASLKLGNEMWTYMPSIERSMKIPPSMMLQGWMGSDFTNDDMVKSSSIVDDYTHTLVDTVDIDGQTCYVVELIPDEEAAVVWGKILYYVRGTDYLPVREDFYDEDNVLVRRMDCSEFQEMGGRVIPTVMTLTPLTEDKEGHTTTMRYLSIEYDVNIRSSVFSRANLERSR